MKPTNETFVIEAREVRRDLALFYDWTTGRMEIRERHRAKVCPACGKFDPRDLIGELAKDSLNGAPALDAFITNDMQVVLTSRAAKVLSDYFGDEIEIHPIARTRWRLAMPTMCIFPRSAGKQPPSSPFRFVDRKCRKCGRASESTIRPSAVVLPPGRRLAAYWVDDADVGCPNLQWVCEGAFREHLKKHRLTGLKVQAGLFGPGSRAAEFERRMSDPKSPLRKILDSR